MTTTPEKRDARGLLTQCPDCGGDYDEEGPLDGVQDEWLWLRTCHACNYEPHDCVCADDELCPEPVRPPTNWDATTGRKIVGWL